jgi:hypothetical protein
MLPAKSKDLSSFANANSRAKSCGFRQKKKHGPASFYIWFQVLLDIN